jgi:hypothetical protein
MRRKGQAGETSKNAYSRGILGNLTVVEWSLKRKKWHKYVKLAP